MSRYLFFVMFVLIFLSASNLFTQEQVIPFYPQGTYNNNIPTPESILGFPIGSKPTRYDAIVNYLKILDEKSNEVQLIEFGKTYEGRSLYHLIITSENNFKMLNEIQNSISKLADPRKISSDKEALTLIETTLAIAWMAYGIHGDELSSLDAAVQLAYQLAAGTDETTIKLKNELIILIDPMENPDGRERYLAQMQQWQGEVVNSDAQTIQHTGAWPWGRGNHYLFDMNRDWFLLVHPESKARVQTVLKWNPQLLVDAHEMGSYDTYLFSPAGPPFNPNMNEFNFKWRNTFAKDQAKAFDKYGWNYYTREWNDEWYPGYGSGWSLYIGAIGILYEQAQTDGSIVKRPDGTILTFHKAVHQQFVSSFANLTTASNNRKELLREFFVSRKKDMVIKKGEPYSYIILPGKNLTRSNNLIDKLLKQNIEVSITDKDIEVENLRSYWNTKPAKNVLPKGTYIINLDQPMGRLAKTILEFDPRMDTETLEKERKKLEKNKQSEMYDVMAWSLPIAYGVESYCTDKKITGSLTQIKNIPTKTGEVLNPKPAYGYLFEYYDDAAVSALASLLEKGYKVRSAKETFEIEGKSFSRGTILLRLIENPVTLTEHIQNIAKTTGITIYSVNTALSTKGSDLGGNDFVLLEYPRTALVTSGQISMGSFSTLWHLLDYRLKQRISIITAEGLANYDLRKYNVLIFPSSNSPQTYNQILGKDGIGKIKKWVENGGTLIGIGNAAAFLADTSSGMSKVRLQHQALNELSLYDEANAAEIKSENIKIDSAKIWSNTEIEKKPEEKKPTPPDIKNLERQDEFMRLFMPRGAIMSVDLDEEHWLTFGLGKKASAIMFTSNSFLSKSPVQTPARFADYKNLRISGLLWPEAKERWQRTAYITRESMGSGQIILFAGEPNFRGYFHGTERLFLNSMLLGPGWGTSRTVEW
ncbi:MAG: M14 family metallopeptidase [Bacteroidota bacterium]|nr:M14 family metallopeptidase [Bacteroidota bacterium]